MTLPNFLIIGAAKAGTTSLYHYLSQHPQIYMSPVKEPRFFAPEFYTTHSNGLLRSSEEPSPITLEEYQELFKDVTIEKAIGEASTEYLYFPKAPERIKSYLPDTKLIVILRNPAERAYSAYCYQLRDGCETLSFEEALKQEAKRKAEGWRPGWLYRDSSLYCTQLKRYLETFDSRQIKIYLHRDLKQNTEAVVKDICIFLGVSRHFKFDKTTKNVSYIPKNFFLNKIFKRSQMLKTVSKTVLPDSIIAMAKTKLRSPAKMSETLPYEFRVNMVKSFVPEVRCVEGMIGRDLSHWLSVKSEKDIKKQAK